MGIGALEPGVSSLTRAGYLTNRELQELVSQGAVGDVCGWHFDIRGQILDIEINRRVVGLDVESLRRIPAVMGVAAGKAKAKAILGALRTGLLDILVTDSGVAREVLQLAQGDEASLLPKRSKRRSR